MSDKYVQDPGHGGEDPGALANGNTEKVYTLEAAKYVDKRLADHGISSVMTRDSDVTLEEGPRVSAVKKSGAKKCLSHHFNAGGGSGIEVIHSIFSDGSLAKKIIEEFKKAGYPVRTKATFSKKGSNGKDYYYMHRRTGSVETDIIEYEFVDGPQAEKIKEKKYREGMYECVVRAVCREENVEYKPLKSVVKETVKKPAPKKQVKLTIETNDANAKRIAADFKDRGYEVKIEDI